MTQLCENCKTENRDGANFCKYCSHLLSEKCPRCNFIVQPDSKFCDNCQLPFFIHHNIGGEVFSHPTSVENEYISNNGVTGKHQPSKPIQPKSETVIGAKMPGIKRDLDNIITNEMREKLDSARIKNAMVGQRRTVTMLFCDVEGSTEAAEKLDPEYWAEIMNEGFEYMISPIYKYEGTVARLMGDAILAFFGAPITHEDDPTRAILAGLDIVSDFAPFRKKVKKQWGIDVNVRIGINTGMVMVGQVGNDLQMEYTAMGDEINLAARMEQTAKPGTVHISEATYKRTAKSFEFEDLGAIEIKGKDAPIQTYRPISKIVSSQSIRGFDNIHTPLIGRDSERKRLIQSSEAVSKGIGQIVLINGEAGLGKSRLISELVNDWNAASNGNEMVDGHQRCFESTALSYETNKPYGLFRRLIKSVLNIKGEINNALIKDAISDISIGFTQTDFDKTQKVIESMFGLSCVDGIAPLKGETFKSELFETIISFWEQKTKKGPIVLIFDDLHWADSASVALLEHLFTITNQSPVLIICSTRPEKKAPNWRLKQISEASYSHRLTQINIRPLSEADSNLLIDNLLQETNIPILLRDRILEKTEGNPFFIEEIIRLVLESNTRDDGTVDEVKLANLTRDDINIPRNLQALLIAKIDRLEDDERHTLQLAALIGRSFYYRILATLTNDKPEKTLPQHINVFQQMDLIREAARDPELEYIFRHALTQEAAYSTILIKQRRVFHKEVAETIENLFAGQTDDMLGTLADHYENGNVPEKAYHYTVKSGDQAYQLYALDEAIKLYTKALKFLEKIEVSNEDQEYLYLRLGRALEINSNYQGALKNYQQMGKNAETNGNKFLELSAIVAQSTIYSAANDLHDTDKGLSLSQKALALAKEIKDEKTEIKIQWNLLNGYRLGSKNNKAIEAGEAGLKLARKLNLEKEIALIANDLPHALFAVGQIERGLKILGEARDAWKSLGNIPMLGDSLSTSSLFYSYTGNFKEAMHYSKEAYKVSKSINNHWGMAYGQFGAIEVYWQKGDFGKLFFTLDDVEENGEKGSFSIAGAWSDITRAIVYREIGLYDKGIKHAKNTLVLFNKYNLPWDSIGYGILAALYFAKGETAKAKETIDKGDIHDNPSHANFVGVFQGSKASIGMAMENNENELAIEMAANLLERIEKEGYFVYQPGAYLLQARTYANINKNKKALNSLALAEKVALDRKANWLLWKIYYLQASIYDKEKELREGKPIWKKANKAITAILATMEDEEIKTAFLNLPNVKTILESNKVAK